MTTITEKRFREGSGEKYLKNGKIRCQAISKSQLRQWREEFNDYVTPAKDVWPECQCSRAAEPGAFACRWHGGISTVRKQPRSLLDVMPIDLAEKMKTLMENPNYLSSREDILLMQTRIWELLEELESKAGSEEAWGSVAEAKVALDKGNEIEASMLLEEALDKHITKNEIWAEIRKTEALVKDLKLTQVKTAKDLQQMATTEQVMSIIMTLYDVLSNGVKKYIDDTSRQAQFLREFAAAVNKYANLGPEVVINQLESTVDG